MNHVYSVRPVVPSERRSPWLLAVAGVLAMAPLASAQTAPEAMSKEARHERMIELQATRDAHKPQHEGIARQAFTSAQTELDAISASLGGDLPCAAEPRAAGTKAGTKVAPTAPTGCVPTTTSFTNAAVTPIADLAVTTSTIIVAGAGPYLWDLDITTNIAHTFAADLDITIQSPAGTVVTLTTDNGAGNDNVFDGTVWDDDANPLGPVPYTTNAGLVTDHPYVNLTLASPLVPEEALAAFVGEDPNGTWTLTISDDLASEAGSLNGWSLGITTFAAAPNTSAPQIFDQTTPTAIPTGPAVVSSTLAVSGLTAPVCNLQLRTPTFTHTFSADLDITLTSPTGTVVTLTTDNGAGNDNNFNGTVWTDDANPLGQVPYTTNAGLATDHPYVNLTTATPLVPEESMGAFMGEDGNGTWTVTVSDDLAGDGGSFTWGLDFVTCSCPTSADVSLTVVDTPDPVDAGNNITYTLTAANAGPADALALTVDTTTPPGTTFVSVTAPTLTCTTPAVGGTGAINCVAAAPTPAAGSHVITLVLNVDSNVASGSIITLNGTAGTSTTDSNAGNNAASASTTVTTSADLAITKTDGVATATPGGTTTYTIVVSNSGPSDAPGTQVTDTLVGSCSSATWSCAPTGTATCAAAGSGDINDTASVPAGDSVTYTAICTIPAAASGTLVNTATVTNAADSNAANNTATDTDTLVASADLALLVTDAPDPVNAGGTLVYNASLTNNGPSVADTASLSFPLAANTTFSAATPSAGGSCVTPAVGATGTVTCTWAGATGVGITHTLALTVQVSGAAVGSLNTTATASAISADPNAANNSAAVSTAVGSAADLSTTLSDTPDPVTAGTNLTYTATVTNNGPSDAQAVQVATATPTNTTFVSATPSVGGSCVTPAVGGTGAVTCTWAGATVSGTSRSVTFIVQVAASATGTINATATASSTTGDSNATNNAAAATTAVAASADLGITLTIDPSTVTPGSPTTVTATATNAGPSDAQGVQVTVSLPAGMGFQSVNPGAGGSCITPAVGAAGNVVCTYAGATPVGTSRTVVVTATVNSGGTVSATVTSATPDPAPGNSQANGAVVVNGVVVTTPSVIPTLGREQALWLGLMLGLIGVMVLRRRD